MLSLDETTLAAEQLRTRAARAASRAADAHRLAAEIEVHRQVVVTRVDRSMVNHTPEVWQSRAATDSRLQLLTVGFSLGQVSRDLIDTRSALESAAADLDSDASGYRRQAAVLDTQAAAASLVSKLAADG